VLKHLISGFHTDNLPGGLMMVRVSVRLFMIHHRSVWELRACIHEVAKLADMVREVVSEVHLHKVEIQFVNMMLCDV